MKKEQGITLTALVITLIIIIILIGVTIETVTGDNGLIAKAKVAVESYEEASEKESEDIKNLLNMIGNIGKNKEIGGTKKLASELNTGEYVYYPKTDGEKILCQVLYDEKYDEVHKTNYGVQVVALSGLWTREFIGPAVVSSALTTLSNDANNFRNPSYTTEGEARCIGSNPEIGSHLTGSDVDINRLKELAPNGLAPKIIDGVYWYASTLDSPPSRI